MDGPSVPRETDVAVIKVFGDRSGLAERYAGELSTTGAERGLIGPREVPRLWDRHILNCAALSVAVPPDVAVADVGSGAGLPGLVLAIARPDLRITLIEPLLRRVAWLSEVVERLGLTEVEIVRARAEEVAATGRRFDVTTARAVAPLETLLSWCLPLLKPNGVLLAIKGESAAEEVAAASAALRRLGGISPEVLTLGADLLDRPTTVVRVTRSADTAAPPRPSRRARSTHRSRTKRS